MSTLTPKGDFLDYSLEEWKNGSKIEFILYPGAIEGEDPSDQLQMVVVDQDGKMRGWIMNVEDAITIIRGLSRLVDNAIATNKPVSSNYEVNN